MKRNLKRLFSLLLVACMILSMMPASVIAEGTTSQEDTSVVIGDSAISEESANEENTTEELTTEDNISEEDNSEDATSEEDSSEDVISDEDSSEDIASEEGGSEDIASEEGSSEDIASEEGGSEDIASEEGGSEDIASEEGSSEDIASEEGSSEDITSDEDNSEDITSENDEDSITVFDRRPGGGMETSEEYFNASNSFGYDSFTSGGNLSGVKSVTVGGTPLSRGVASSTTGAAASSATRISFNPGWYLYRWKVVCGDKYSCQTDAAGNVTTASNVMSGASEAYYDLYITQKQMGHSSRKAPYWLLIELKEDTTKYPVTYNWGILEGTLANDAPEGGEYTVSTVVTVQSPSAAAISEAAAIDYEFVGWVMEYNSVSQSKSPNSTFAMPRAAVTLTAQWKIATTSFTTSKVWADNDNQDRIRPASVTVQLKQDGADYGSPVTLSADNNWTYTWEGLPKRPSPAGNRYVYSVDEPTVPEGYTKSISESDGVITNTHVPEKISVSGSKTWVDNSNQDGKRPDSITVNLMANGNKVDSKTVTAADGWAWTFENLDKYANGEEIVYTIEEEDVDDYTADVDGFDVTNTHEIEKIDISGSKTWVDNNNQDGKRPDSITVNLMANGDKVASATVSAEDGWTWTFVNLDKYANGEEIVYTIEEEDVEDYTADVDGFDVTNTHEVEKIDISGSKTWDDNDNQDGIRPKSITVNLMANGNKVDSATVSAEDGWAWTFENMDKYAAGEEIVYTIEEEDVEDYTADVDGFDVTNSHTPATISISGEKTWVGDDNVPAGDPRPASIKVYLNANGKKVDEKTVTPDADGKWTYSFENVPKFAGGEEIVYTITEEQVTGYTFSNGTNYDIVNTYTPGKTSVTVTKSWDDGSNQDGIRPESVMVQLKLNLLVAQISVGEPVELNAANQWTHTFTDLDATYLGLPLSYTVTEVNTPEDYTSIVSGNQNDGYTITNTHEVEKIDISGEKTWVDNDNQDGKRPDSITIYLFANGDKVDSKTVTAADGWAWTFENMDKYAAGEEIVYTIEEAAVAGYTSIVDGFNVTNTHAPQLMNIPVSKQWVDISNKTGIRPATVSIYLMADGVPTGDALVLSSANGWTGAFTNLPVNKDGKTIQYTIVEKGVTGYSSKITGNASSGFVVTNTLVTIPVTGDDSNLTMYAVLFTFGAIVAASALILSKKKYGRRG